MELQNEDLLWWHNFVMWSPITPALHPLIVWSSYPDRRNWFCSHADCWRNHIGQKYIVDWGWWISQLRGLWRWVLLWRVIRGSLLTKFRERRFCLEGDDGGEQMSRDVWRHPIPEVSIWRQWDGPWSRHLGAFRWRDVLRWVHSPHLSHPKGNIDYCNFPNVNEISDGVPCTCDIRESYPLVQETWHTRWITWSQYLLGRDIYQIYLSNNVSAV